ncbi:hypothetical protein [Yinghuangia sp. YIM S10712]
MAAAPRGDHRSDSGDHVGRHLRENMQALEVSLNTEQFERLAALEDPGAG